MNRVDIEQKVTDYNELIGLLNNKLTILSTLNYKSDPLKAIDNKIDIHKLKVEIREKTAYRDKLLPLLKAETEKHNGELEFVKANFEALLKDTKALEGDMEKKHKAMFRAIKNHFNKDTWESESHMIQGYRTVAGMKQHYEAAVS
jgi:predicted nuclease with TOPRIM domain